MKDNCCSTRSCVGCSVCNCVYNDNECKTCTAEHIRVEAKGYENRPEAACGTYTPKTV